VDAGQTETALLQGNLAVGNTKGKTAFVCGRRTKMSRYLDAPLPEVSTDAPDIATTMRTNPRVKVILCSTGAAMLGLVVIALIVSNVF
jgi:hypothetical protein